MKDDFYAEYNTWARVDTSPQTHLVKIYRRYKDGREYGESLCGMKRGLLLAPDVERVGLRKVKGMCYRCVADQTRLIDSGLAQ